MMYPPNLTQAIQTAAAWITQADSLIITAGAGIGVDSGLPDFRGDDGFWRAYPALQQAGISFHEIANPASFSQAPALAWGFYGHRLARYRNTQPHEGFQLLHKLANQKHEGAYVITSNVDGHFQKAGFNANRIWEIHGSIHYLQCSKPCCQRIWSADKEIPMISPNTCRWEDAPLPVCPYCQQLARPNILMFNDWHFVSARTDIQESNFHAWRQHANTPVIIEIGAGTALPSIRRLSERMKCPLIRINPTDAEVPSTHLGIALPLPAKTALELLYSAITED